MKGGDSHLFFLCSLLIILLCGCAGMQVQEQGQTMATVELEGNPTTGYTWVYTMSPEGVAREVSSEYIPDTTNAAAVGSGGKFVFVFEAVAPGEAELSFSYLRVWEENIPPLRTLTYKLIVDDKNSLTMRGQ